MARSKVRTMRGKPVIMLIDDEDEIRSVAAEILRPHYEVVELIDGRSAWQALLSGLRPHVILTDLYLPVLSGHRLVANLRSHPELTRIPLVLVSADPTGADVAAALAISHFLPKPYDTTELLNTVAAALGPRIP